RDYLEHGIRRRERSLDVACRDPGIARRRLQHRILQRPGGSRILIVGSHVEINGIHLFILEDAELGQPTAAAGGGNYVHVVGNLTMRLDLGLHVAGIAVAASLNSDPWEPASARSAACARAATLAGCRSGSRRGACARTASGPAGSALGIQTAALATAVAATTAGTRCCPTMLRVITAAGSDLSKRIPAGNIGW